MTVPPGMTSVPPGPGIATVVVVVVVVAVVGVPGRT
jgi:hypothetical protein